MSSCYITLSYHIISYHISCSFILSLLLIWSLFYFIWSLFYSILFYFISNRFDLIEFFSLLLKSIYYIVQYSISYQWMICVYLSVHPSVCLSVWINLCFLFSPVALFFLYSFFSLFIFISLSFLSFLMNVFLTHTHGHGHTNKYEYMFLLMTRTYYFKRM